MKARARPPRLHGATTHPRLTLDGAAQHAPHQVLAVLAPPDQPDWAERLAEIGFIPGESVAVLASAKPGDDPLVVRVGTSTFALRRAEAACVQVLPLGAGA